MDLNELLFHHQVALIHGAETPQRSAGGDHDLARPFESMLLRLRDELGAAAYPRLTEQVCAPAS